MIPGAHVEVGCYSEKITHYTVLRTIEAFHGLAGINNAASLSPTSSSRVAPR